MKVALVHDFLGKLGGAEGVLSVFAEMYPDAPIYTLFYDEEKVGSVFPAERVRTSSMQKLPPFVRKYYRYFAYKFPRLIEEFDLEEYDLVISSSNSYSHGIVTSLNTKHLCYCHSPMRYVWDWTNEYRKENKISGFKSLLYTPLLSALRRWDFVASDRPTKYLANSQTVQGRIKKYYGQDSEVVFPPVETDRFEVSESNEGYFLIVSTLTPYKRVDLAVELFNKIGRHLVIIGDGPHRDYLESIAGENIEFLGFKDDDIVAEYMKNCRALIFAGEDDFGITPVEAMACGKPVLAYGKGGCTETVISGKTGEFFFEPNVSSMEDGLARLMFNEKHYRPTSIRRHALQFSRAKFEKKIRAEVKKLV